MRRRSRSGEAAPPGGERSLRGQPARYRGGLVELGDGVHAWMQPNGSWGEANAGLVVGDGESLLIDTLWDLELTRRMLAAMATRTAGAPIRWVVNTHADGDHWWGNALVAGATILATPPSAQEMAAQRPVELVRFRRLAHLLLATRRLPPALPGVRRAAALGELVDSMLAPFRFREVTLRRPDRLVGGEEVLGVGGREVRLLEVGPAHTAGDAIVHVPDARVVFAADLLFIGVTPIMWAGPVASFVRALDRVLALDAAIYVPGHGPLCSAQEVRLQRDYWTWLEDQTRLRHAAGQGAAEAAREIALDELAGQPWASWEHPERLAISVDAIVRGLEGQPPAAGARDRVVIFTRVAELAQTLRCSRRS